MRAFMGIDTSKDWDDQEEEEDEAATLIKLDKTKSWECVPLAPAALEVITNDTMQGWRTTSDASEYVPFAQELMHAPRRSCLHRPRAQKSPDPLHSNATTPRYEGRYKQVGCYNLEGS